MGTINVLPSFMYATQCVFVVTQREEINEFVHFGTCIQCKKKNRTSLLSSTFNPSFENSWKNIVEYSF